MADDEASERAEGVDPYAVLRDESLLDVAGNPPDHLGPLAAALMAGELPPELVELVTRLDELPGGAVEPPTPWQARQLSIVVGRLLSGELDVPAAVAAC